MSQENCRNTEVDNLVFDKPLYVGVPNIGSRDHFVDMIDDMFERKWLSNNGKYIKKLQTQLQEYLGVKHVIPVCNATVGLDIAARALGMQGEVLVPSFTFVATAHILQWQGVKPIFVDVHQDTHLIDEDKLEKYITDKTTGIIGVHLWGQGCNIEKIEKIAHKHNLKVLYDAAHAMGCSYNGKKIGSFGDCEVFSFHATKVFNTFEGGAITTNNDELAEKIKLMINFGFNGYDQVDYLGINGKMNEASAAMGIINLAKLDTFIKSNEENYNIYQVELDKIVGIRMLQYSKDNESNYHYIVIQVDEKEFGMSRDQLCEILHSKNVIARKYFYPGCHNMEPYKTIYKDQYNYLSITNKLCKETLVLPNSSEYDKDTISKVCEIIRSQSKDYREYEE